MHRFQKNRSRFAKSSWGWNASGSRGKSFGKKKKIALALGIIVLLVVLFQGHILSFAAVKGAAAIGAASAKNAYHTAVDWAAVKLGLSDTAFLLPVSSGVVVEDYGVVLNEQGEECYHGGVDVQVPEGSEVLAAEAGEITAVDTDENQTIWITLKHEGGWSTVYGRLGSAAVKVGDTVEKGTVLGTPQKETLHFEVLENGSQKNPVEYFQSNS